MQDRERGTLIGWAMNARALLVFVPSGLLIPFFWLGSFPLVFLFDAPFRGPLDKFARVTGAFCISYYPQVWFVALALAITGLICRWRSAVIVTLAVAPFVVGVAPFLFFNLLQFV